MHKNYSEGSKLIVPGTTVAVNLMPGYIEVRDKGVIKKKILTKNKSFDEVLAELNAFFKRKRKILPPTLLHDVLLKIGLPKVKLIVDEEDIEVSPTTESEVQPKKPAHKSTSKGTASQEPPEEMKHPSVEPASREPVVSSPKPGAAQPPVETTSTRPATVSASSSSRSRSQAVLDNPVEIGGVEVVGIEEALTVVESMTDTFLSARRKRQSQQAEKPKISINIGGTEEIEATTSTTTTVVSVQSVPIEDIPDPEYESLPTDSVEPEPTVVEPAEPKETVVMEQPTPLSTTSSSIVKPLVIKKVVVLGEEEVGKASLVKLAEFNPILNEDLSTPYVYEKVFETETHRVNLQVWSFDEASTQKVSRRTFYADVDVAIIVYSTVDRWSFESIDFWIKEVEGSSETLPPIVLVGNKIDQRDPSSPDAISNKEGFALAEHLAELKRHDDETLHPIAFVETTCTEGDTAKKIFQIAAELAIKHSK